ncbi:GNAT family N-acyltransferase [Sulfitobacter pacificus]|uniref:GNAT family N-acyltransferase n=1 Tax=Sulfitobacter pacificus TaxID=1499314 RepID=UPI00360DC3F9
MLLPLAGVGGGELRRSYASQYYGLAKLEAFEGRMLELGRFCIAPACRDPDVLRLAWAVMTEVVDRLDVQMLFGCSSFAGVESDIYHDSFALLRARHLAPACWSPGIMAPEVFEFAKELQRAPNVAKAWREMPPLLRTYLMMGGWVSDHAVVDRQMNTLHVFTGVEVAVIPEQRKRLLRALV